jgi:predicted negative regulator of RcsB-dependent stress response
MDPVMQALFGKMPISQLPSVQAAVNQKNNNTTILIMGAIIIVGGVIAYNIYKENQELKVKLKAASIKSRD